MDSFVDQLVCVPRKRIILLWLTRITIGCRCSRVDYSFLLTFGTKVNTNNYASGKTRILLSLRMNLYRRFHPCSNRMGRKFLSNFCVIF